MDIKGAPIMYDRKFHFRDERGRGEMSAGGTIVSVKDGGDASSILERCSLIMEFVAKSDRPVPVSELIRTLSVPKPSAHRICRILECMGMLVRDPLAKGLVVGPRLLNLALDATLASGEDAVRRSILRAVVEQTGETCSLTIMVGDELFFLDRVESESPLRLQLFAGSRVPLYCTSGGKLFLAFLPAEKRERFLRTVHLKAYTENTITDPKALQHELAKTRKEGIGHDNQEFVKGLIATAVPVFDAKGRMRAAVSVNAPAGRSGPEEKLRYIDVLRQASEALSNAYSQS